MKTWRMILLDRRKHVAIGAHNSWVLVLEGTVGGVFMRTKEILGVINRRLLRTLGNSDVSIVGAPCIAWPPTYFDLDQLPSFHEGFPDDWISRIRPTLADRKRNFRGAIPRPLPSTPSSSTKEACSPILPTNSVVLRRFITGWKQGRVTKTVMIDGVAKVAIAYAEKNHGDLLSRSDISDLTEGKMMWTFKADADGWIEPEVETLTCAVKSGLSWDIVAEKINAVVPISGIRRTAELCQQKAKKLRLSSTNGLKASENLKERLRQDAKKKEKPFVDVFNNTNVLAPTVDTKVLGMLLDECPDLNLDQCSKVDANKENTCDDKSEPESSEVIFPSPQPEARKRFVFQQVSLQRSRSRPGSTRFPPAKLRRKAPRSDHETLQASLGNILRKRHILSDDEDSECA